MVTAELKINYLRPAAGDFVVARASVVHRGARLAVCRCDVFAVTASGGEVLCAAAQGTITTLSKRVE